jgi:deoxycytidine triphosphate deaminase
MGLLNREQIFKRLEEDEIFVPGTWEEAQLRSAGYDLRISSQVRGFNDTIFEAGEDYGDVLTLAPGDSAYVVSYEHFCMPWDLAANLGVRFRFARMGLSVLTGLLVDPGYGLGVEGTAPGAPLHFFVVNVGSGKIQLRLGERGDEVLSIQLLETEMLEEQIPTPEPGSIKPEATLGAFQGVRQVESELAENRAESKREAEKLKADVVALGKVVENTNSAMQNIVVFGVFLFGVSLLGVSATILLEMLANQHLASAVDHLNELHGAGACIAGLTGAVLLALVVPALVIALTKTFSSAFSRS